MTTSVASPQSERRSVAEIAVSLLPYLLAGMAFGFIAVKSEILAWYRIQEMFRFQSFHMYGVIGSAVLVGATSIQLIKRFNIKSWDGQDITIQDKDRTWLRYILGGTFFGLGWGLIGACPGPMLALIGAGLPAFLIALVGAILGTRVYGMVMNRLPHG